MYFTENLNVCEHDLANETKFNTVILQLVITINHLRPQVNITVNQPSWHPPSTRCPEQSTSLSFLGPGRMWQLQLLTHNPLLFNEPIHQATHRKPKHPPPRWLPRNQLWLFRFAWTVPLPAHGVKTRAILYKGGRAYIFRNTLQFKVKYLDVVTITSVMQR